MHNKADTVGRNMGVKVARRVTKLAVGSLLLGWLIPGGGHFLQGRFYRGLLLLISIAGLFFMGLRMQGKIYLLNSGDILDMLGFIGDLCAGGLYFLTRAMDWGHGAIQLATADYGTKFIIVAGLLNFISAVDAYDIAMGKKP